MTKLTQTFSLVLTLAACASVSPAPGTAAATAAFTSGTTIATSTPTTGTQATAVAATQDPAKAAKPKLVCNGRQPNRHAHTYEGLHDPEGNGGAQESYSGNDFFAQCWLQRKTGLYG